MPDITMANLIDIYHGSVNLVEKPVFGLGKTHNDYGRGFYCTEHVELANGLARRIVTAMPTTISWI